MGFFILVGCTAISVGFWKYWYDLFNIQEKKIKNLRIEIPPSYEQNGNINNNGNIQNDGDDQPLIGLPPSYYSTTTN
tara:strand:+ start:129 stop:359 length:231 start_codon:yes stop_codon:yes gene_type:complete